MKDWDYYTSKVKYPSRVDIKEQMLAEIDNEPLTTAERKKKLDSLKDRVYNRYTELWKPHREDQERLEAEFWQDCRDDIGYCEFLTEAGVAALESKAWDDGHSGGYANVHCHLVDLARFAETIIKSAKKRK